MKQFKENVGDRDDGRQYYTYIFELTEDDSFEINEIIKEFINSCEDGDLIFGDTELNITIDGADLSFSIEHWINEENLQLIKEKHITLKNELNPIAHK
jgi:hypothetical protein